MQASITPSEFRHWLDFYRQWPFDDLHRYHRPAALIAHSSAGGGEAAFDARLEWLQPSGERERIHKAMNPADESIFRAAGLIV